MPISISLTLRSLLFSLTRLSTTLFTSVIWVLAIICSIVWVTAVLVLLKVICNFISFSSFCFYSVSQNNRSLLNYIESSVFNHMSFWKSRSHLSIHCLKVSFQLYNTKILELGHLFIFKEAVTVSTYLKKYHQTRKWTLMNFLYLHYFSLHVAHP